MKLVLTTLALSLLAASPSLQDGGEPAPPPAQQKAKKQVLSLGVYTTDKPSVMYVQFNPMAAALEQQLEKLGHKVEIKLVIFKTYQDCQGALVNDEVDFVRIGPASYVLARQRNPRLQLLAMESNEGKKTFQGYIVVRKDSPIKRLEDLAGRSFAFGDETSTIGRYLSQARLLRAGIDSSKLSRHDYLGRHDKVYRAVAVGDFDAGALKSGTFDKLDKKKSELRVLESFDNITKPWIARSKLPAPLSKALRSALLAFDGSKDELQKRALEALNFDGFLPADDKEYDFVRQGMKESERFTPQPARPLPEPRPGK